MPFNKEDFKERTNRFRLEQKTLFLKHFDGVIDNEEKEVEFITFVIVSNPSIYEAFGCGCKHCACSVLEHYVSKIGTVHPLVSEESKEVH